MEHNQQTSSMFKTALKLKKEIDSIMVKKGYTQISEEDRNTYVTIAGEIDRLVLKIKNL